MSHRTVEEIEKDLENAMQKYTDLLNELNATKAEISGFTTTLKAERDLILAEMEVLKAEHEHQRQRFADFKYMHIKMVCKLEADNARMREVLDEIINAYDVANGEYFCLNCGLVIATYEERCSECGADLSIEYDGLIKKAKQALKGGE